MQALAEGQVPVGVAAVQVELVRDGERRLPAGGGQPQEQPGACGQVCPASLTGRVVTRRQTGTEGS